MFPQNVYHCPCVSLLIKLCLVNEEYSLSDICKMIRNKKVTGDNIYYCKCGNELEHAIFSCKKHMRLISLCERSKKRCFRCMGKYLKSAYNCCYDYTKFDVPTSVKKDKKTLKLIVQKLVHFVF